MSGVGATNSNVKVVQDLMVLVKQKAIESTREDGAKFQHKYIWKPNSYTLIDGTVVSTTRLMVSEYAATSIENFLRFGDAAVPEVTTYYSVLHPSYADGKVILKDVMARLHALQTTTMSESKRIQEFLICLDGFYAAYPYLRGTSAIGRVYFMGVFKAVFGVKATFFEDGIDLVAMILSDEGEFTARYQPRVLKNLDSK